MCKQACVFNHTSQAMMLKSNKNVAKEKNWASSTQVYRCYILLLLNHAFQIKLAKIIATEH